MKRLPLLFLFNLGLTLTAIWLLAQVALTTRFNVHPDEYDHLAGFCYFEQHLWPPDLNDSSLVYSPYGWSRVYSGEIMYPVFALLSKPMELLLNGVTGLNILPAEQVWRQPPPLNVWSGEFPPDCAQQFMIYRFLNITLLLITLVCLFWWGRKQPWLMLLGLTMISIPQVVYLYVYANNDAWALSVAAMMFAFALMQRRLLSSTPKQVILGILLGVMLLSKPSLWAVLPFIAWVCLRNALEDYPEWHWREWVAPVSRAVMITSCVAFLLILPMRVVYPLSQGDYAAQEYTMRMEQAAPPYRPADPTQPGYFLAERGVPFSAVLLSRAWYQTSWHSFYAWFGYLSVPIHAMAYRVIFLIWSAGLVMTCLLLLTRVGRPLRWADKALFLVAALVTGLSVLMSLYYSWSYDLQPQGRYLFSAVVPLSLLLWGTIPLEPKWLGVMRTGLLLGLSLFSLYIIWIYIVLQPDLVALVFPWRDAAAWLF